MTPKISLIIGIAAALGVFAPVASAVGSGSEIEYPGGYPQSGHGYFPPALRSTGQWGGPAQKAEPAIVKTPRFLQTKIEGGRTLYRLGNRGAWME